MIDLLDTKLYKVTKKSSKEGYSIRIKISRTALDFNTELIDSAITSFDFEILLTPKYPFVDPQVLCHSKFAHPFLSLNDGRDLFNEVVGSQGWRVGFKLQGLVQLLPEFV